MCRCGFNAEGGNLHLHKHLDFYRRVPGQEGKHGSVLDAPKPRPAPVVS